MNNLESLKIFVHSAGYGSEFDYYWKDINNSKSEKAEKIFSDLRKLIYEESKSLVIAYDKSEKLYSLFITAFDTKKKDRSRPPRKITADIIITFPEEKEKYIRKLAIAYLQKSKDFEEAIVNNLNISEDFDVSSKLSDFIVKILDDDNIMADSSANKELKDFTEKERFLIDNTEENIQKITNILEIIPKLPKKSPKYYISNSVKLIPILIITDTISSSKIENDGAWVFITNNDDRKSDDNKFHLLKKKS